MPTPTIDPMPPAPEPTNPRDVFSARSFAFFAALAGRIAQMNAALAWVASQLAAIAGHAGTAAAAQVLAQDAVTAAQAEVVNAQAKVTAAQGYAIEAQSHASDAANAAYSVASPWAPGAYTANQVVWLNTSSGSLYRCIADVNSAIQPNLDDAHWVYVGPAPEALPASTAYTRTGDVITKITEDGEDITIAYNADGTVNTVSYPHAGKTRTETYSYTAGVPTGMTATEI